MPHPTSPLEEAGLPEFNRIIADSDLDGLCAAAVLKAANPSSHTLHLFVRGL
jgi:hypothetical protein